MLANLEGSGIEPELYFTEADDCLHPVDDPAADWTETMWWSFIVPERLMCGWLYTQVRPNLGTQAGGAFVYDNTGRTSWELPYFGYQHHQPLPEPLDLRDVTFRTGVSTKMVEPGMAYELGYRFRDQTDFIASLRFEGLTPPVPHAQGAPPFTRSNHFDQHGRITGTIELRGEEIQIDSVSVRDRSWGRRPEILGRTRRRLSYTFGHTDADELFLAFCMPDEPLTDTESLASGYLVRDGQLRRLTSGVRRTRRDPNTGAVRELHLECTDSDQRLLSANGLAQSCFFMNNVGVTVNSVVEWTTVDGGGFGEDQDVWTTAHMNDYLRQSGAISSPTSGSR
ncbi:MAG: hypothetical protein OXI32_15180 [bacterium]|nr:hypothetical protein [bacterium]